VCLVIVLCVAVKGVVRSSMKRSRELVGISGESRVGMQRQCEVEGQESGHENSNDDMFASSECNSDVTGPSQGQESERENSNDDMFASSECNSDVVGPTPTKCRRADNSLSTADIENVCLQTREHRDKSQRIFRTKKQCPLCGIVVTHLPRHLRSRAHKWKADEAKAAVGRFQLRKVYNYKNACTAVHNRRRKSFGVLNKCVATSKDYHRGARCPYKHCQSVVKRLSRHLVKVHNIRNRHLLSRYVQKAKQNLTDEMDTDATDHSDTDNPPKIDMELNMDCKSDDFDTANNSFGENVNAATDISGTDVEPGNDVATDYQQDIHDAVDISSSERVANSSIHNQQTGFQFDGQSFQQWLTGPDGGRIDMRSAQQHVRQIRNIIGRTGHVDLLLNKDYVLNTFLNGHAIQCQYQPGTIKSHLASLMHLYDFWLLARTCTRNPVDETRIQAMKQTVKRWSASYRKDVSRRCFKKMDEDLHKIITPADIAKFTTSQTARDALKVLGKAQGGDMSVTRQEYTLVRDHLMTDIILRNATRPGVLAQMQTKDVKDARLVDDHFVISVSSHKTSGAHGPAKIIMTRMLYSWLTVFTDNILPQLPIQSDLMFRSWTGEAIDVGRCFQLTLRRAGLRDDMTCTLFRKSAVSKIHQECPAEKANLADLMCHRPETATRWYRVVDKEQTCVRASATLTKAMTMNEQSATDEIPEASMSVAGNKDVSNIDAIVSRRKMFTERQIQTLVTCCRNIIDKGRLTKDRITAALSASEDGTQLLKSYTMMQILTRLAYERRKTKVC